MGNSLPSQYEDRTVWTTLSKHAHKQLLQHKSQTLIIEKHTINNMTMEEVSRQRPIYDWRTKTNLKGSIQILQMRHIQTENELNRQSGLCCANLRQGQLVVYTEHLTKLYEGNDQIELKFTEQFNIFRDIVDSIEMLAHKFACFSINKEMVGFNSKRIGKAWINQNFACNGIQLRQHIQNQEDQIAWEGQTINALISISLLHSNHSHPIKFNAAIQEIRNYQLFTFASLKSHFKRLLCRIRRSSIYQSTEEVSMTNKCRDSMIQCSHFQSERLKHPELSTSANQKRINHQPTTNYDKNLTIPGKFIKSREPIYEKGMPSLNKHISKSFQFLQETDIKKENILEHHKEKKDERPINYVHINRYTKSIIIPSQTANLVQLPTIPVSSTNRHPEQVPSLQNRRSNKEIKTSRIHMIDSMFIVEQQAELEEGLFTSNDRNNLILQESIILRR